MRRLNKSGFTILELLIATTIFSVILMVVVYAIIYISASFIKGTIVSQTQKTARTVVQQISQDIQLNSASPSIAIDSDDTPNGYICVGNNIYVYQTNVPVNTAPIQHALVTRYSCSPPLPNLTSNLLTGQTELLGNHMKLTCFAVTPQPEPPGTLPVYNIKVGIAYLGNGENLVGTANCASTASCPSSIIGNDFCAVVNYQTTVQQRIQNAAP